MMKLKSILIATMVGLGGVLSAAAMTDAEVVAYIKAQSAAGKSEQQIGRELMAKGVTQAQVQRIKAQYQYQNQYQNQNQTQKKEDASSSDKNSRTRTRSRIDWDNKTIDTDKQRDASGNTQRNAQRNAQRNTQYRNAKQTKGTTNMQGETDFYGFPYLDLGIENDSTFMFEDIPDIPEREIFGHSFFNNQELTFEPNENMATPQDYRLGPGDEVIIDIWGASEDHLREIISPEGSIMIAQLGPVYLNGKTIQEANKHIRSAFAQKYAGVDTEQSDVNVTLGEIRSIQVDVMGEVTAPGTFRLSPFSNVFHALYRAGGINDIGTLRKVQVLRNGRTISTVDLYDYLFKGKQTGNVRLQEGDVIIVAPAETLVEVEGGVKRPMWYEVKNGETLADVLKYAGGYSGGAYTGMATVSRQNGKENEMHNVASGDFSSFAMRDGDLVAIGITNEKFTNRVELRGAVNRPGFFALDAGTNTIGKLIRSAEGTSDDAFEERVVIYREGQDMIPEVLSVNLKEILSGKAADVALQKNDVVIISSTLEIEEMGMVSISGFVAFPGEYSYARKMTIEGLIMRAGGLMQGASTAKVEVSRRIDDPAAVTESQNIAQVYSFSLENGLVKDAAEDFYLEPYDIVEVRKSPTYMEQQLVKVEGEVLFTGQYALQTRNERLSSLIKRAGGIIDGAYVKGASLRRKLSDDEKLARDEMLRMARMSASGEDSISVAKIDVSDYYNVGINLEEALKNPGSYADLVLRDGDQLNVPQEVTTVRISGDVLYPNTVAYVPGKNLKYYIDQAGGYGQRARKGNIYVVQMNGSVSRGKKGDVVEPGSHIVVPSKEKSNTDWGRILSMSTSFGSLATMAATIASLFRK